MEVYSVLRGQAITHCYTDGCIPFEDEEKEGLTFDGDTHAGYDVNDTVWGT
jgi:hypothetical protein